MNKAKPRYRWSHLQGYWYLLPDAGSWFTSGLRRGFPLHVSEGCLNDNDA